MIEKDYRKNKPEYNRLGLYGKVTVTNGDITIVKEQPNAIVRQGMRHIASALLCSYIAPRHKTDVPGRYYFGSYLPTITFGTSSATTTATMDDLVTPVVLSPISVSGTNLITNDASNLYTTAYIASWNSGTINAVLPAGKNIAEVGFYINCLDTVTAGWSHLGVWDGVPIVKTLKMFSRISLGVASFIPDETKPVSVEWILGGEFI